MHLFEVVGGRGIVMVVALVLAPWAMSPAEPHGRVVVTDTETTILDVVEFVPGTATLRPNSLPTLDAVAATLIGNPSIELVEVQSHTSGRGDAGANLALSQRRADAVVVYLISAGVPEARLEAEGYGDSEPLDPAAPTKNERISFLILQRSTDP